MHIFKKFNMKIYEIVIQESFLVSQFNKAFQYVIEIKFFLYKDISKSLYIIHTLFQIMTTKTFNEHVIHNIGKP